MDTLKQLFREFWIPFLVAVFWTAFSMWSDTSMVTIASVIKSFTPAFFLASWASGQFVRVSRQARTDRGLKNVEARIIGLTSDLESATTRLLSTVSGGDSYAYIMMMDAGPNAFTPMVCHSGEYPLSNVSVRLCDLNTFKANLAAGNPGASDTIASVGELAPNTGSEFGTVVRAASPSQDWNAFFSARNGMWTQRIRGRLTGGSWQFATCISRHAGAATELIYTKVPKGFPIIGEADFDDAPRK